MALSLLNVDLLLHLMKFMHPVARFNLALSGSLKGFENVNKGISLHERYSEQLNVISSCNKIVFCPELIIVELN